jgi:hypothetical protein
MIFLGCSLNGQDFTTKDCLWILDFVPHSKPTHGFGVLGRKGTYIALIIELSFKHPIAIVYEANCRESTGNAELWNFEPL